MTRFLPLIKAINEFFYETRKRPSHSPYIRDIVNIKRWMMIVVYALIPCTIVAIWNCGIQRYVFGSANAELMTAYQQGSKSIFDYLSFSYMHMFPILKYGLITFMPILIISYLAGGFWELLFAIIRRHDISEGFLVTGILFALILPSTIPYWLVATGVSLGVIISKEVFGGTGMNILNPALVCRALLYFGFPTTMVGSVWIGTNPTHITTSLTTINQTLKTTPFDGITQTSPLGIFNISNDIKCIHIDAIGMSFGKKVLTETLINNQLSIWRPNITYATLTPYDQRAFITTPIDQGGLGLSSENYLTAFQFSKLKYLQSPLSIHNFLIGNRIGSLGETSIIACLLGAFLLIGTGIASWRTMISMLISAYICASLFEFGATHIGPYHGAFNPAKYALPAHIHLLIGSLAFGAIFMATEPVTSPYMKRSKWMYGALIGVLTIVIRIINPAYPEGVMLAILIGNVCSPLIDHYTIKRSCRGRASISI